MRNALLGRNPGVGCLHGVMTVLCAFCILVAAGSCSADIQSVTPTGRCDKLWWLKRHQSVKAKAAKGGYEVVFLGDSITHFWEKAGRTVWDENFATGKYKALNCGFAGDTTENLLWRIDDGELDGLDPRAFVLLIGTNNTGHRNVEEEPPSNTVRGVQTVIGRLRTKFPKARVVLHPLLPRSASPDRPVAARNAAVNLALRPLADGRDVLWCDFNEKLKTHNGWIDKSLFPDLLHPSEGGYRIWAAALKGVLDAAFAEKASVRSPRYVLAVPKDSLPIEIAKESWVGRCLLRGNRVPFEEVDDRSFTDAVLADTRIVFMGRTLRPSAESEAALARFRKRGGAVVRFNRYQFKDANVLYRLVRKAAPDDAAFWTDLKAKNARIRAEELKAIEKMPGRAGEIRRMSFHDAQWKQKVDGADWSWDRAIGVLKPYGFTVAACCPVYPNYAYYRSKVFPVGSAIDTEGDVIEAFVAACRKHGIRSCVSFRCFKTKVDRQLPEPYLAEWTRRAAEPGRMAVSRKGKVSADALCPAYPDTRRRMVEGLLEIAAYGVDQLSLDFVRFIDADHCFCERCKAGIAAAGGDEGRYRRETVTSVVREARDALKAKFPKVELAASVFQNPDAYSARIGQPWDAWCAEGLLDEINPMDYLLEPEDFERLVRQQVPRQTHGLRTVPIFGPNLWPDDGHMELRAAEMIRRVRTVDGTAGFSVFLFERRTLDILEALAKGPLRQ